MRGADDIGFELALDLLDAGALHVDVGHRLGDGGADLGALLGDKRLGFGLRVGDAALCLGAPVVEFHTGEYAHAHLNGDREKTARELKRLADMAALAAKNGIEPHAGHGLTYENVQPVAAIPQLAELNIGHYLIGEAVFVGLENAVRRMRDLMDDAR